MTPDFTRNFFELFGQQPSFRIDPVALEQAYRDLQSAVHPDRHAHLSETERRVSMQWATQVNEAYRTLKEPLLRAQYVLRLHGVETHGESSAVMPSEFLIEQMEWREAVEEAQRAEDTAGLERLSARLRRLSLDVAREIEREIDQNANFAAAADAVRRLMFIEKLQHGIDAAFEALES